LGPIARTPELTYLFAESFSGEHWILHSRYIRDMLPYRLRSVIGRSIVGDPPSETHDLDYRRMSAVRLGSSFRCDTRRKTIEVQSMWRSCTHPRICNGSFPAKNNCNRGISNLRHLRRRADLSTPFVSRGRLRSARDTRCSSLLDLSRSSKSRRLSDTGRRPDDPGSFR
jgi:hypothetical protein